MIIWRDFGANEGLESVHHIRVSVARRKMTSGCGADLSMLAAYHTIVHTPQYEERRLQTLSFVRRFWYSYI
jgi:hypothetical protein